MVMMILIMIITTYVAINMTYMIRCALQLHEMITKK